MLVKVNLDLTQSPKLNAAATYDFVHPQNCQQKCNEVLGVKCNDAHLWIPVCSRVGAWVVTCFGFLMM